MKAIETVYGGRRFRSRLEARWAVFFDTLGVPYVYEPEGYDFGTHKYLPDFWLPDSEQFVEVKGVMSSVDREKIELLVTNSGKDVVVGLPNMQFIIAENHQEDLEAGVGFGVVVHWSTLDGEIDTSMFKCSSCGCVYFASEYENWSCPKCGTWKGRDHRIGYGNGWLWGEAEQAKIAALSARFEYGENGS